MSLTHHPRRRWQQFIGLYGSMLLLVLAAAFAVRQSAPPDLPAPRTGPMLLPADYRATFTQYATVDRSDAITRHLYISPESLAALERGQPLPEGTRIIIEAYRAAKGADGRLQPLELLPFIHMAEKRRAWRLPELATSAHVGEWNFASFDAVTRAPADRGIAAENLSDCFTCHDASAAATRDFIFTRREIDRFALGGTLLYVNCPLPDRLPCR